MSEQITIRLNSAVNRTLTTTAQARPRPRYRVPILTVEQVLVIMLVTVAAFAIFNRLGLAVGALLALALMLSNWRLRLMIAGIEQEG